VLLFQEPTFREELSASIFRVTRIDELGTTLTVTSNQRTLRRNFNFLEKQYLSETISQHSLYKKEMNTLHASPTSRFFLEDSYPQLDPVYSYITYNHIPSDLCTKLGVPFLSLPGLLQVQSNYLNTRRIHYFK
jgi:hypothetical protein